MKNASNFNVFLQYLYTVVYKSVEINVISKTYYATTNITGDRTVPILLFISEYKVNIPGYIHNRKTAENKAYGIYFGINGNNKYTHEVGIS